VLAELGPIEVLGAQGRTIMSQIRFSTSPSISNSPGSVVSAAVVRAAKALGLTDAALARLIGLSEPMAYQLASGSCVLEPGSEPYERALLLVRLLRGLDAVTGGEEEPMRAWMQSHNLALGGVPAERARTVSGLVETVAYLESRADR
jgi:transcriptional regulator with XRE-family HTH domain